MINPFDMKETIEWYGANQDRINLPGLATSGSIQLEGKLRDISPERLVTLRNQMPLNALERSVFRQVVAKSETYFLPDASQKMANQEDPTTQDVNYAMSPTAIVPSFYSPVSWNESDVWLYNISQDAVPDKKIREIILAEGFVHELGHALNFLARHKGDEQLYEMPDGTRMTGTDCMNKFGELFEKLSEPMSHYSSGYKKGNEFHNPENPLLTVDEELSETIAAYQLGFVFSNSPERRFQPFVDRPEVERFTKDYLNAKLIPKERAQK